MKEDIFKKHRSKYEEINDCSFLNSLTEEIVNLTDKRDFKNVFISNFDDEKYLAENIQIVSEKVYQDIVHNVDNSQYKILLHNLNSVSYLEIISTDNDKNYTLQLCDNKISKVENTSLDNVLTYLMEDSDLKLNND